MSAINWPVIAGICVSAAILLGGVLFAGFHGAFRTPGKRINIANLYTDENIKRLRHQWRDEYRHLEAEHKELAQQCENRERRLTEVQAKLLETRLALKLLSRSAADSVPILQQVTDDEVRITKLENALHVVQTILDRP